MPSLPDLAPQVLVWPAMGVQARYYKRFPELMAARGWRGQVCEWRGHGTSDVRPGRGSDWGYRELVEQDMASAAEGARAQFPGAPVWIMGHSLGGQLGMLLAASRPDLVDRVVTVAACSVHWRAFPGTRALTTLAGTQLVAGLGTLLGSYPGHRLGFAGLEAKGVVRDWARQARTGRYAPTGSQLNYEALLNRCEVPVLNLSIAGDEKMAPPSAVDALSHKVPASVRMQVEDPAWATRPHFAWVKQPARVFDAMASFADDTATSSAT